MKEDYVSFEVAKLLKEKGFDWKCCQIYYADDKSRLYFNEGNTNHNDDKNKISAPTLQMTMKWLREIHKLHITIFSQSQESWMYRITKPGQRLEEGAYCEDFRSYEETADAAIKDCLTNLI